MKRLKDIMDRAGELKRTAVAHLNKPAEPERYVIIGPTKAGKTVLVAALYHATLKFEGEQLPYGQEVIEVQMLPKSEEMKNLIEQAADIFVTGQMPVIGTQDLYRYRFEYKVRWRDDANLLIKEQVRATEFVMLDGPGGALFGGQATEDIDDIKMKDFQKELTKEIQRASGIVMCIDSTNEDAAHVLFKRLPLILIEAAQLGEFNCTKLVVCLTKADDYFATHAERALYQLKRASATERAVALMARPTYRALRQHLSPNLKAYAGWTSVYGYLDNGQVNFDKSADALRIRPPDHTAAKSIELWQPFRVIDPFVFLCSGLTMNLEEFA